MTKKHPSQLCPIDSLSSSPWCAWYWHWHNNNYYHRNSARNLWFLLCCHCSSLFYFFIFLRLKLCPSTTSPSLSIDTFSSAGSFFCSSCKFKNSKSSFLVIMTLFYCLFYSRAMGKDDGKAWGWKTAIRWNVLDDSVSVSNSSNKL